MKKAVSDIGILTETFRNLEVSVGFQWVSAVSAAAEEMERPRFSVVSAGIPQWN